MALSVVSYTGRNGTADTTINNITLYTCRIADDEIVQGGTGFYTARGDGQDPNLGGIRLKGKELLLNVQVMSGSISDGMKFWAALFSPKDTTTKTLVFTDGTRQWQVTGRSNGVKRHKGGGNFTVEMLLDKNVIYTVATTTETTMSVVAEGQSQVFNLSIGNDEAYPVYDVIPLSAGGYGQRYRRFLDTFNWTKLGGGIDYPINITGASGLNTSALVNFTSVTAKTNGAINASVTTIAYDNPAGGAAWVNLALPFMMYRAGEQIRVTARTGGPTYAAGNLTVVRGINGSTATSHADNTDWALSKMAFDGRDLRVLIGNGNGGVTEAPYWFGTSGTTVFNSTGTYIWTPITYAARAMGSLTLDINDTETSFTLANTTGYIDPTDGLLLIDYSVDREIVTYETYDPATKIVSGLVRGAKGSTAHLHTAWTEVRAIQEIWLYYGNASATAPNYNVSPYVEKKPVFNLATSTNTSWVYESFALPLQKNVYEWKKAGGAAAGAIWYTSDRDLNGAAISETVTELGASVLNRLNNIGWVVSIMFGYYNIAFANIDRYNLPASCALLSDTIGGSTYISATTAANTWQTESITITPGGTSRAARFTVFNNLSANFATRAAVNIATATVNMSTSTTSDTEGVPYVSLQGEQDVTFDMAGRLENTTTGESLSFVFDNMAYSSVLRIDTLNKVIWYMTDGRRTNPLPYPARENWLRLVQGNNTLKFWGWTSGTINVVVRYQGRSNTFA